MPNEMIFVGDIAHPFHEPPTSMELDVPWSRQLVVANLEGALVQDPTQHLECRVLFNHISVCEALSQLDTDVVTLANNHIADLENGIVNTIAQLRNRGVQSTGAGRTLEEAEQPARITSNDREVLFLAFGWEAIQCVAADSDSAGVNPLRPKRVLRCVRHWRHARPEAAIVILPHWNYSLEQYPQPAHRQLAMAAIEAGADAVIGHHPHRVGGVEIYRGSIIAYSLGNWWLPQGVYFDGRVSYPHYSRIQLALEWAPGRSRTACYWFEYHSDPHRLTFLRSESLEDSDRVGMLTPFSGMAPEEYRDWFRNHRSKRMGLPIYNDYRKETVNQLKDQWVSLRHKAIMAVERSGLRDRLGI